MNLLTSRPALVLVAGPNGADKSTVTDFLLK
jgi:ABC-type Mn2+/Zn2+ transport system ATPase subunit